MGKLLCVFFTPIVSLFISSIKTIYHRKRQKAKKVVVKICFLSRQNRENYSCIMVEITMILNCDTVVFTFSLFARIKNSELECRM